MAYTVSPHSFNACCVSASSLRSISHFFRSQQWSEKVHTVELKIAQRECPKVLGAVEELVHADLWRSRARQTF